MTSEQESYASNKARVAPLEQRKSKIRELNDALRTNLRGGLITMTPGVKDLGVASVAAIVNAVREFNTFDTGNDPYGEHEFGAVDVAGKRI